jgi:hypothetical protein
MFRHIALKLWYSRYAYKFELTTVLSKPKTAFELALNNVSVAPVSFNLGEKLSKL